MPEHSNGNGIWLRILLGIQTMLILASFAYTYNVTKDTRDLQSLEKTALFLREQVIKNRDDIAYMRARQDERTRIFPDLERRLEMLERRLK